MSTHISNVTVSKENDSSIKSSSTSCQALLTPNQKMYIDNTADRLNRHMSSQIRRPSLQIPDEIIFVIIVKVKDIIVKIVRIIIWDVKILILFVNVTKEIM